MKKITYLYILVVAVLFSACEEEAEKVTISSDPSAPALTSPGTDGMEFEKDDAAGTIDYTWDEADFGFDASVTYVVQIAMDDTFTGAADIATSQESTGSAVVADVNAVLLAWGLTIDESATIKGRVYATVSADVDTVFSEISDFTVTPYETLIDYPMAYVPGAYQGWSPGADDGRLYSYNFNSVYQGVIRIIDGAAGDPAANTEFKITPEANWDNAWGGSLTADGTDYAGTLDAAGGNFSVVPGVYEFIVDVNALTISMEKTDDWGIIGDSTPDGWDGDTDMTYNGQRQVWEITTDLTAGEFKFRANDAWDLNLGDTGADGTLEGGGDNIAVAAGNYTIRLDVVNSTYQLIAN
ncbi:MAG: SusE domain-containing protein [Reichenbachiella sp.]|uniref:SusE domain-containing protein n=1 Tax=Reichenbachiella sp. TaxID=2184521 RepID=UPI003267D987